MSIQDFITNHSLEHRCNNLYHSHKHRVWIDDKITIYKASKLVYKSEGLNDVDVSKASVILSLEEAV